MADEMAIGRRDVLKLGAVTAAAAGVGAVLAPAPARAQAAALWLLSVDIPGAPEASRNIREIAIDALTVAPNVVVAGPEPTYRVYDPGAPQFGSVTLTANAHKDAVKDLKTWFQDAARGKGIRKDITITLRKSDGTGSRTYNLIECFPTRWSSVNFDTSSTVQTETLTCTIGRIELG